MKKVSLKTSSNNVPIIIENTALKKFDVSKYVKNKDVVIITNTVVGRLYLKQVNRLFKDFNVNSLILPDGERYKTTQTLEKVYNFLLKNRYDRSVTLVALGGGVIGDLVAFAADTFMRGVSLIHIPTTLLAQVDSSIGGKCGVNHPLGKNLIGSFKHPKLVLIDTYTLKTLPRKEFMAGMAEVIKYALIKNKRFFNYINKNYEKILGLHDEDITKIVHTCATIKSQVVTEDELENGTRALLNFGHTFGHAIEASKNFKGILHGEAVSIGMNIASAISADRGHLNHEEYCEIEDMLDTMNMPTMIPKDVNVLSLMKHLNHDKKKISGKNRFILLKEIGDAFIDDKINDKYLADLSKNFIS